ncbi:hypothetical protein AB0M20_12855 [Actinoplanes sp. NPDC051633]|uniref:hypothetical protein n=1 Tax=Actinoplanes sp. NPDC051633 TaxID=3155670 RepID=UPI00343D7439
MASVLVAGGAALGEGPGGAQDGPETVLRAYVQATLSTNDSAAAATVTCREPNLTSMQDWQLDLSQRRQRFALPALAADVTSYQSVATGRRVNATADVAVTLMTNGQPQERVTRPFRFTLVSENGWKVCGAAPTE